MVVLNSSKGYSYDTQNDTPEKARLAAGEGTAPLSPNSAKKRLAQGITDLDPNKGLRTLRKEAGIEKPIVDPSQPNPANVQAGAGLPGSPTGASYDPKTTALTLPKDWSGSGAVLGAQDATGAGFKQGLAQTMASGAAAPASMGQAAGTIQASVPAPEADTSAIDLALNEDKGWQELLQIKKDFFDPREQKTSLMDTYNKLYKAEGLGKLDEEILDAKTIIDGTEDDIRNEVQAAGGFGTNSQVQALALARNKSLLKNYNNLVGMREMKENHLNTMMSLAEKDRAYADQKFDQALNFNFKVMEYRDKFIQNTASNIQNMAKVIGWDGIHDAYSKDPRQLAMAEKALGVPAGSLAMAAQRDAQARSRQNVMDTLDLENQRLQNQKLRQDIGGGSSGNVLGAQAGGGLTDANGKPLKLTATQVDTLVGFDNTLQGANKAQLLLNKGVKTGPWESIKLGVSKFRDTANPDQLDMEQTLAKIKADFMKSISGAAVSESEAKRLAKFLPEYGDQEGVIQSKLKNLIEESNKSKSNYMRTLGASGGMGNVVVGPDGNEYEIVD